MVDLTKLTIKKFHDGLRAKEFSAREVAQAHFERIKNVSRRSARI